MSDSRRVSKQGRPPNPNAKRRGKTRAARARFEPETATPELINHRRRATGGTARQVVDATGKPATRVDGGRPDIGLDFWPDVLHGLNLISQEERDEALRYRALAWGLFGEPHASVEAIYERMVAAGLGDDYGPRLETSDPELRRLDDARLAGNRARLERMESAVMAADPNGRALKALKAVAQHDHMPAWIAARYQGARPTARAIHQVGRIKLALEKLVEEREREDRYQREKRQGRGSSNRLEERIHV